MAGKSLTRVQGGVTDTININNDKFAGVRTMKSGHVYPPSGFTVANPSTNWSATATAGTDGTEWNLISNLGNDATDLRFGALVFAGSYGSYASNKIRVGKHRVEFEITLNSGSVTNNAPSINDRPLVLAVRDRDDDPSTTSHSQIHEVFEGVNVLDVEVFDDGIEIPSQNFAPSIFLSARPHSVFDVTVSNIKVTHNYVEHTVDRRLPSGASTLPRRVRTLTSGYVYPSIIKSTGPENAYYDYTAISNTSFRLNNSLRNDGLDEYREVEIVSTNHVRVGKSLVQFDLTLHSGDLFLSDGTTPSCNVLARDGTDGAQSNVYPVTVGFNSIEVEVSDDGVGFAPRIFLSFRPDSLFDITISNLKVTHNYGLNRLDKTVPKALPLLSKLVGGASAAYSLRDLNDKQSNSKVVRVRRAVDSQERDFIAKDIGKPLEDWVAGTLDIKLPADFKDSSGNSLASGAYSLRKVKSDYEGPAVDLTIADKDINAYGNQANCSIGFDRNNEVSLDSPVISGSYKDGKTLRDLVSPSRLDYGYANYANSSVTNKSTNLSFETLDGKGNFNYTLTNNQPNNNFYFYLGDNKYTAGTYEMTGSIKVSYNQLGTQPVSFHWGWAKNLSLPDPTNGNGGTVYEFTEDNPLTFTRTLTGNSGPFIYNNQDVRVDNLYVEVRNLQVKVVHQCATVNKWYDQSGNNNHLENTTYNQQPILVRPTGEMVRDRDGKVAISDKATVFTSNDLTTRRANNDRWNQGKCLKFPEGADMLSADGSYSLFAVMDFDDQTKSNHTFNDVIRMDSATPSSGSARKPHIYLQQGDGKLVVTNPSFTQGSVSVDKYGAINRQLYVNIVDPSESTKSNRLRTDGRLTHWSDNATVANTRTYIRGTHGIFDVDEKHTETFVSEFIYYPSNQKPNEFSVESNINNHWNMFTPQDDGDAYVSIWYDQSSYGNDVSSTASNYQPRLVISGQLSRTPDGKPAVKFSEGTDMRVNAAEAQGLLSDTGHSTSFVIAAHGGNLPTNTWHNHWMVISTETDPNRYGVNRRPYMFRNWSHSGMTLTHDSAGGPQLLMVDDTTALFTCTIRGLNNSETVASAAISKNGGTENISNTTYQGANVPRALHKGTGLSSAKIGNRYSDGRGPLEQWIVEIIHYASDQTANVGALNANIINQYEL